MSSNASASLASMAIKNPIFQNSMKKAAWDSLNSKDEEDPPVSSKSAKVDPATLDINEDELAKIEGWAKKLRYSMILLSTLMIITAWYNVGSITSPSLSGTFIAMYLTIFSCLFCCFEIGWRQIALVIVQNFGFMYNTYGKIGFLMFVAVCFFTLSVMGKVMFALAIAWSSVLIYVNFKHPKFTLYMKKLHYYNRAKASTNPTEVSQK